MIRRHARRNNTANPFDRFAETVLALALARCDLAFADAMGAAAKAHVARECTPSRTLRGHARSNRATRKVCDRHPVAALRSAGDDDNLLVAIQRVQSSPDAVRSPLEVLDPVFAGRSEHTSGSVGSEPPSWLQFVALAAAAGVLSFGLVGLVLAVNSWYRPALAFPIGAVMWIGVLVLARPALASNVRVPRYSHVFAAIGIALILAITAWNATHASQHVLVNRDGGSYANTARWIAREGSLTVKPRIGPFAQEPSVRFDSFAVYQMPDGTLQFQFAHLLPVVLAEAYAIKGDAGLFHGPEVLGGVALLAFYVLSWRLMRRPLFALSAMLALAFLIPQISFSRDSYSEIPSQILLFTALWLLVRPGLLTNWRVAFTAGLFLGALESTRIDAIVFLIGVPVIFATVWLNADGVKEQRATLPPIAAFAVGLVPGMFIGLIDLTRHAGLYYSDLSHDVRLLASCSLASAIVCAIAVATWPWLTRCAQRLPWSRVPSAAAVLVASLGFVAWLVRPRVEHVHSSATIGLVGGLQAAEHVPVDATRTYFERSFTWMSWYLGPLTIVVAIIAAGLLTRELLRGRMSWAIGVLAVLAPVSLLYLYKASAVPDQVWVDRRFLVGAFPLLILLALGLAAVCFDLRPRRGFGPVLRVGAVSFAILAVAYPVYTLVGVRSMSEQRGFLDVFHDVCADIGPHAAVIVLEQDKSDLYDEWVPQGIRSWCGAVVGVTRGTPHTADIQRLAREWNAQGKGLFVVAKGPEPIESVLPGVGVISTRNAINTKLLEQSLTHRPDSYRTQSFSMTVAQVPPG